MTTIQRLLLLLFLSCTLLFAEGDSVMIHEDLFNEYSAVGLVSPLKGKNRYDDQGSITGVSGINLTLGYTVIRYFKPVQTNTWNTYWQWGTFYVAYPYVGVGTEYQKESGFFYGFNTIYYIPTFYIGFRYG